LKSAELFENTQSCPLKFAARRIGPRKVLNYLDWNGFLLKDICIQLEEKRIGFEQDELSYIQELVLATDRECLLLGHTPTPTHLIGR